MKPREGGFTLLEMLVALVVFGLVMAGLAQAFGFGLKAWSEQARVSTAPAGLAAMDGALRRMIEAARPGGFAGGPDRFAFTTRLPPGAGLGQRLADVAVRREAGGVLVLRYAAHPPGVVLGAVAAPRSETLATGVTALRVRYLAPRRGRPASWVAQWNGDGLPLLVRVHLRLADGRHWPDLVAAPVAGGDGA